MKTDWLIYQRLRKKSRRQVAEQLAEENEALRTFGLSEAQTAKYQDVILQIEQRYDTVLARRS